MHKLNFFLRLNNILCLFKLKKTLLFYNKKILSWIRIRILKAAGSGSALLLNQDPQKINADPHSTALPPGRWHILPQSPSPFRRCRRWERPCRRWPPSRSPSLAGPDRAGCCTRGSPSHPVQDQPGDVHLWPAWPSRIFTTGTGTTVHNNHLHHHKAAKKFPPLLGWSYFAHPLP